MSIFEDFSPVALGFSGIKEKFNMHSESLLLQVSQAMLNSSCSSSDSDSCRDDSTALTLKLIAIGSILVAGVTGISIPLIGKQRRGFLSSDSNLFVAAKAFAAGVILATGFVHMLPDGSSNLTNSCLPTYPWSEFPFAGFLAMCSALLTLVADFVGTQIYEKKQGKKKAKAGSKDEPGRQGLLDSVSGIMPVERVIQKDGIGSGNGMQIVGIHAHADQHGHSHLPGGENGDGVVVLVHQYEDHDEDEDDHGHGHSHSFGGGEGDDGGRHAVVSQVLELGIVSHSVIIGLSIGVSHSPCTIRPLVAALSFHQFFEGFALGGCISEAQFKTLKTILMACFFAVTTPSGIAVGIGLASFYNEDSPAALIVEGILDSISAGILIYMSLVDLIAADFMSKKMRCNVRLQIASYFALFLGATLMSSLAIWS